MVELTERSACAGLVPLVMGNVTVEEVAPASMTSLSAFGDASDLSGALEQAHGVKLPAAGRSTGKGGVRCIWFGRGEVMLIGAAPDAALANHAAVVDQSDAWAVVSVSGAGAVDVLARLVPLDLRAATFKRGHTARSQLGHMNASITRTGADAFQIMVFRSMAGTLLHDLKQAMAAVASRG
ncbi:sarcosine oxidase subunit gamma family protein [Sulfitobacter geojensis]|uniref:Sarcosine oxidase subunit gamma n=1 Tax=Sulfitobacter geojensis TaxID=1342299 RepID=A0AAE2VWL2_9RHOB|nr:sarcosine oxidase subunit gamma [Sulfitobacter geojensis]MBM1692830.1 sarcosine oxidase subunit gamma [Sulfitobacter geojensis]MBM1704996.1 sarcosine oxidase subunit gamma [Sulfitobacter geojensis]MBM1709054.1 sarcosine oxidase subunit gamma [Sulfitobacter geojensis]MBM1713119.1 sarcosine oxidase subunit gamma [Sulfitobacter geojensis]